MSLQSLVSLAEIVNALAVTFTLVVLVVSIRQNTKAQKVLAVESLSAAVTAISVPAMESPTLGSALSKAVKDWGSASRDERILAHFFLFSYFKLSETAWYQQKSGTLEAEQWAGWDKVVRMYYHSDGVRRVWWPNRRHAYSPAFQKYLAESEPPAEVGTLDDIFNPPGPQGRAT
jgi:hypothetical protein